MHSTNKTRKEKYTMKKALKVISVILALAMVACCFASCGSKEKDTNTTAATGSSDTTKTETKDVVKLVKISLTDEEYGFAVGKNDAELLKSLNEYIAAIKTDGTLNTIMAKYFEGGTPTGVVSAATLETDSHAAVEAVENLFDILACGACVKLRIRSGSDDIL